MFRWTLAFAAIAILAAAFGATGLSATATLAGEFVFWTALALTLLSGVHTLFGKLGEASVAETDSVERISRGMH